MASELSFTTAFAAGLVSFASPCVLPLIPAYLSYITGSSLDELRQGSQATRAHLFMHAVFFCLGFSLVFIAAGLAAGTLGNSLQGDRIWLARLGGLISIILGLQLLGVLRLNALMSDRRLHLGRGEQRSCFTSVLVGIGFAAGWSPCIGPILAGILLMAASQERLQAGLLLSAYSLGLALPFLLTALAVSSALDLLRRVAHLVRVVEIAAGGILVAVGLLLLSGQLTRFSGILAHAIGSS